MAQPAIAQDGRMTVEEFVRLDDDPDGVKYELVDGVLQAISPATVRHGAIQAHISRVFGNHLRSLGSPCQAITEPAVVIPLRSNENMRIPDVGVTCSSFDETTVALPEPILLVEVLSPGKRAQTMENVRAYTTILSVQEILVVNTVGFGVLLLRRREDGSWPPDFDAFGEGDQLTLHSIDLKLQADAVYP